MTNQVKVPSSESGTIVRRINEPTNKSDTILTSELDIRDIFALIRRQWVLVLMSVVVITGGCAFLVSRSVPEYRARATIRIADTRGALTAGIAEPASQQLFGKTTDPLLSQIQVLRSRAVIGAVVDAEGLRLISNTDGLTDHFVVRPAVARNAPADTIQLHFLADHFIAEGYGVKSRAAYGESVKIGPVAFGIASKPAVPAAELSVRPRPLTIDGILLGLHASRRENTDIIDVEFVAEDKYRAQRIANAIVRNFQDYNVDVAQQQSRRRRLFIEQQLAQTDSLLTEAQAALSKFRSEQQVFSSRERLGAEQASMMELEMRSQELATEQQLYERILERYNSGSGDDLLQALLSTPGVMNNPIINSLTQQMLLLQSRRDSLATGKWATASTNPDVVRLDTLIARTQARVFTAVRAQVEANKGRLNALHDLKAHNAELMTALPATESEEMRLLQRVEITRRMADQLSGEYQLARISEAVEGGQVEILDLASVPRNPIPTRSAMKISAALLLALLVGAIGASFREHLNTKVHRRDEIEPLLRIPSLAVIPRISRNGKDAAPRLRLPLQVSTGHVIERPLDRLVTVAEARSSGAEAYRTLRTNLLFSQGAESLKRIVVTSSMAAEGKTTTAANLAVTFAQQGKRVIIVDGDLRKPNLHRLFGITREPGLVDVLVEFTTLDQAIRPTAVPNLAVISVGTAPPNPSELLGSHRMTHILNELAMVFDVIIVDAPPVLVAGDASILAAHVDGTILVVRAGQTERAAAQAAVQQLHSVGAYVLGAVLNDPDAKVPTYEGYHYYAYQYYGEEVEHA